MFRAASRLTALSLIAGSTVAISLPAHSATDNSTLVIQQVYGGGGNSGAIYRNDFVVLKNPSTKAISVNGWSVQYRSATGTAAFSGVINLGNHEIPAGASFLVAGAIQVPATPVGDVLPEPDASNSGVNFSAANGTIALVKSTTALTGAPASVTSHPDLVDLVGYGSSNTFETAAAPAISNTTALLRAANGADTNDNSADFTAGAPLPVACGVACDVAVEPEPDPVTASISQIQGTGAASPLLGQTVTTTGVVTARFDTGGFNGAYLQTPGTGGVLNPQTHKSSTGIFVYGSQFAQGVQLGETLNLTGKVSEFNGLTQLELPSAWSLAATPGVVTPSKVELPLTETQKEAFEGMLLNLSGQDFTVTNNYATNQYGEVGLAVGTKPLMQPTNEVRPGTSSYDALVAQNALRAITVDDGKSTNFFTNKTTPLSWLRADNEVRTSAAATFTSPVVLDWRNNTWKLQPQRPLAGADTEPVSFANTRTAAPKDVGGKIKLASFNVLNYFTTTGEDWVGQGDGRTCTWYTDRDGEKVTVNECKRSASDTVSNGPRGAANDVSFARQERKIVKAINAMGADVLSLEEIEDTAYLGGVVNPAADRDEALKRLVSALNADAGSQVWAPVLSPETIPTVGRDVIRTAFVYKQAKVEPVGMSTILNSAAFSNARAPLAQEFRPVGGSSSENFVAIVNHFKSKGSGSGADLDQNDGQGASNAARVRQATALVDFADEQSAAKDTDQVFLLGDFNSYTKEDPLKVIEDAGFRNLGQELSEEETYQFSGLIGSLDHVFASPRAFERVTGADVWTINAPESIAREYSRFNYNVTALFNDDSVFRASDHDPVLVGYDPGASPTLVVASAPTKAWFDEDFEVEVTVSSNEGTPSGTATVANGTTVLGTAEVVAGKAKLKVAAGALAKGSHELSVTFDGGDEYADSSTLVTVEVLVDSSITATAAAGTYGKPTSITVSGAAGANGVVYATAGGQLVGSALLIDGTAKLNLGRTALKPGTHKLAIFYGGSAGFDPADTTVSVTIAKAKAKVSASVSPTKVTTKTRPTAKVTVATTGFAENAGRVQIYRGSKLLGSAAVRGGKASVKLPRQAKGTVTLSVRYSGSATTVAASGSVRLRVR